MNAEPLEQQGSKTNEHTAEKSMKDRTVPEESGSAPTAAKTNRHAGKPNEREVSTQHVDAAGETEAKCNDDKTATEQSAAATKSTKDTADKSNLANAQPKVEPRSQLQQNEDRPMCPSSKCQSSSKIALRRSMILSIESTRNKHVEIEATGRTSRKLKRWVVTNSGDIKRGQGEDIKLKVRYRNNWGWAKFEQVVSLTPQNAAKPNTKEETLHRNVRGFCGTRQYCHNLN